MGNKVTWEQKKGYIWRIPVFLEKRGTSRQFWGTLFPGNIQLSFWVQNYTEDKILPKLLVLYPIVQDLLLELSIFSKYQLSTIIQI